MSDLLSKALETQAETQKKNLENYKDVIKALISIYEKLSEKNLESFEPGFKSQEEMFNKVLSGLEKAFKSCPPIAFLERVVNYYKDVQRQIVEKEIPDILSAIGTKKYEDEHTKISLREYVSTNYPEDASPEEQNRLKQELYAWFENQGYVDAIKESYTFPTGQDTKKLQEFLSSGELDFSFKRDLHYQTMAKILRDRREAGKSMPDEIVQVNIFKKASIKSID